MKTIYKYPLTPTLLLPQDAVILKADMQLGNMYIWALVNPNEIFKEERKFECIGTGHHFEYDRIQYTFINTIFDGPFVWHIFELTNQNK